MRRASLRRLRKRWPLAFMGLAAILLGGTVLMALEGRNGRWGEKEQLGFLKSHWQLPVPPQGDPPQRFSPLEASLDPASCGVCHPVQYEEWKTSLHAKAMGPGPFGQTIELIETDPETALLCYSCHAPLTEQQERHRIRDRQGRTVLVDNPRFDGGLQSKGIACAACHVRGHERFGPPKRDGTLESSLPREKLPHRGVIRTPAFLRSEFCMGCHQFDEGGLALNGKPLENTYQEWKLSPYARQGVQCQDCHMPDRRHLWRGIHDPEMVKRGVTIHLKTNKARYKVGETIRATLTVENTGIGHFFPTYVTPKVFIRAMLVDGEGKIIPGSVQEAIIGREVPLDLSREIYDTRIPPKGTYTFRYVGTVDRQRLRLKMRVVVEPDHFYERFFEAILPQTGKGKELIQQAFEQTKRSPFPIFEKEISIS